MFGSCSEIDVFLLNMSNTLELTGIFVCLRQLIAGLWFARGISTQAGTMVYIYIGFPTGMDGGRPSHQLKICSFPSPGKIPLVDPLLTNIILPPPPYPTIFTSFPLNNNSHVITQ